MNKLFSVGERTPNPRPGNVSLAGYVRDTKTGEPLVGASVVVDQSHAGVATDQYGYFSLTLSRGRHVLYIQSIGMRDTRRQVQVNADGRLNIDMQGQVLALRNVVISSEKASNIRSLEMGVQKIDIKTIKQVPVVFGEADVLKVVLTLPGVKSVGESSTGLNVRGGAADQNLILFNDATIYNPSHFFGLFSAFNPEVVKDVELYKSSIPAQYGGRLSSVLDVTSREGNKKDVTGSAGIGLLTSRLNLEGPFGQGQILLYPGSQDHLRGLAPEPTTRPVQKQQSVLLRHQPRDHDGDQQAQHPLPHRLPQPGQVQPEQRHQLQLREPERVPEVETYI